jgi:hypothetical protein
VDENFGMTAKLSPFRLVGVTSIAALFALSFVSSSFATTPQQTEWHISLSISCKNVSFCGAKIVATEEGNATGATRGSLTLRAFSEEWTTSGEVAITEHGLIKGTWTTGSTGDFMISGIEILTLATPTTTATIRTHLTNDDSEVPVKTFSLDCEQIFGKACPSGVSASESVTET